MFSRGCPYQCTFCSNPQMWTTRYVLRDIDDIINEIKHYINKYKITSVQLYDLTAITKKKWTVELCNSLIKEDLGIKWSPSSGTRSEVLDSEVLTLMKDSNCNYIVYAPESGSENTLKLIKKRVNLKKLSESVLEAKRLKFPVRINLIIGFPKETWADIFRTVWYGLRMSYNGVDEVPIYIFSPYPGSEIFKNLQDQGKIKINDYYFYSIASLNSAMLSTSVAISYNHN